MSCQFEEMPAAAATAAARPGANAHNQTGSSPETSNNGEISPEPPSQDLLRRLEELENLVRRQSGQAMPLADPIPPRTPQLPLPAFYGSLDEPAGLPAFLATVFTPPDLHSTPQLAPNQSPSRADEYPAGEEPLTIPIGHLTPTGNLFSLVAIEKLIGEYPEDYFFQIESRRQRGPPLPSATLREMLGRLRTARDSTDRFLAAFWSEIHPHFPILEQERFSAFFSAVMENGPMSEADGALCLVIVALGQLISSEQPELPDDFNTEDGGDYFAAAYHILTREWLTSFDFELSLVSGLVYMAIYLCYVQSPLLSWRLVHMAATKLQTLVSW